MSNLVLKQEKTNHKRELPKDVTWEDLQSKIDPELVAMCGLDLGTEVGVPFNNGSLLKDTVLFNAAVRYTTSCKPFFSKYDENDKRITDGVTFLQWRFRRYLSDYFLVTRDDERLLAKMFRMSTTVLNPAQWVMRLRAYMYLAVGNKPLYDAISRLEDEYRALVGLTDATLADIFNSEPIKDVKNLLNFKLDGLTGEDLSQKPSYDQVLRFYGPQADTETFSMRKRHLTLLRKFPVPDFHMVRKGEPGSAHPIVRFVPIVPDSTLKRLADLRAMLRNK